MRAPPRSRVARVAGVAAPAARPVRGDPGGRRRLVQRRPAARAGRDLPRHAAARRVPLLRVPASGRAAAARRRARPGRRARDVGARPDAFAINLHTPQREQVSTPVDEDIAGNGNSDQAGVTAANIDEQLHWEFYGPRTEPFLAAAEDLNAYQGPGIWYVSLHSVKANDRASRRAAGRGGARRRGRGGPEEPDPTPDAVGHAGADRDARRRRRRRRRRSEPARRARARRARAGRRPCRRPGAGTALSRSLGPSRGAS